jgi:tricorn protease-like protein
MEDIAWSPMESNCQHSKKLTGKEAAFSTNSDIYLYDLRNGKNQNLTEGLRVTISKPYFHLMGKKSHGCP